jgi:hypothetical protein
MENPRKKSYKRNNGTPKTALGNVGVHMLQLINNMRIFYR